MQEAQKITQASKKGKKKNKNFESLSNVLEQKWERNVIEKLKSKIKEINGSK